MLYNLDFWSAICGLGGTLLIFFFGLPPKVDPEGHIVLRTEQTDVEEIKKGKIYKRFGHLGLSLLIISFGLQVFKITIASPGPADYRQGHGHHYLHKRERTWYYR
jgi:hypothetical protein